MDIVTALTVIHLKLKVCVYYILMYKLGLKYFRQQLSYLRRVLS